jgi:hypothetical protein
MARSFNNTSDSIEAGGAVVAGTPLTMACWFNPINVTDARILMGISTTTGNARFTIGNAGSVAGDPIQAAVVNSVGTSMAINSSTGYTANAWHHACGVFTSATSRAVFCNGGGKVTNATNINPTGMNRTNIGSRYAGSANSGFFGGLIAMSAVWNAALTDAEVAILATGFSPKKVRPQSLVFYAPLVREVRDLVGGVALSDTGTTVADHPRTYGL